jgi:hypothetical protein
MTINDTDGGHLGHVQVLLEGDEKVLVRGPGSVSDPF